MTHTLNKRTQRCKERPTMKQTTKTEQGKKRQKEEREKTNRQATLKARVQVLERTLYCRAGKTVAWAAGEVAHYVGLDLGDREIRYSIVDEHGEVLAEGTMATTAKELGAYFTMLKRSRIALEVGTHSAWVSTVLKDLGHEVYVANPRKMELKKDRRKSDRIDAELLARLVRSDVRMLHPIRHRGLEARQELVVLRARDALVAVRTKLINSMRGLVKSVGGRLPNRYSEGFHKLEKKWLPEGIRGALQPMLEEIGELTKRIRQYDRQVGELADEKHPDTMLLRQVDGVGELTSVAYVLTLEEPGRFDKSREVGAYLGMVPRQYESGDSAPQLRITKTGDQMLRRLLVGSAHYILGPFGKDCDLRRYGKRLAARGGRNARKRAVIAVARKLAVLLHCLWRSGEEYEPLRQARLQQESAAAIR